MNASLFKGGTPRIRYMWCEDDRAEFMPPFSAPNMDRTPPYDAHVDGAYGSGRNYFTLGMPFRPNMVGMEWQRKAIRNAHLQVDDIIRLIVVPEDHFVTALNFKIVDTDARIAGATVALTAEAITFNAAGEPVYTEINDVEDAVAAQAVASPIPVDKPYNAFVSLVKEVGGYSVPLYSNPTLPAATNGGAPVQGRSIALGLKVVSLPTDNKVTLDMALNGWYLVAKVQGFDTPAHY